MAFELLGFKFRATVMTKETQIMGSLKNSYVGDSHVSELRTTFRRKPAPGLDVMQPRLLAKTAAQKA